jgi:transcriptional repressor NrdR
MSPPKRLRAQFRCPKCGSWQSRLIDSRGNQAGTKVRRRHECGECDHRYTSYATIVNSPTGGSAQRV